MKFKQILATSLLGALLMTGLSANASTITYAYDGVVLSCNDLGILPCGSSLFVGDGIGGLLEVQAAAVVPNGQIGASDIASYNFDFGSIVSFNSGNSMITQSFIGVDAAGDLDGGALVISAVMIIPGTDGQRLTLNFGSSFWNITAFVGGDNIVVANGVGKLTQVPVPGALLMFAPALLGFLGLRRKAA
jgi:hypothetical protein